MPEPERLPLVIGLDGLLRSNLAREVQVSGIASFLHSPREALTALARGGGNSFKTLPPPRDYLEMVKPLKGG